MKVSQPIWGKEMKTIELDSTTPRLITAGCSFAVRPIKRFDVDEPIDDNSKSWTELLANKTDRVLIDWATDGVGSQYLHRVVIDSVLENLGSDMIVVVGWSSVGRWERFTNQDGEFLTKMLTDSRVSHEINHHKLTRQKEYKQLVLDHTWFQDHLSKLNYIISLGSFLETHNIKYLFFNAFEPLDGWKEDTGYYKKSESGENCKVLNRATNYIKNNLNWFDRIQIELGAKDGHRDDIIKGRFNNPGPDPKKKEEYFLDGWHPSELANREWSEILYNEICD